MSYTYTELPAPLVIVGLDIAERNIARSAARLKAQGIMSANSRTFEETRDTGPLPLLR